MRRLTRSFFKKIPSTELRITASTMLTIARIMLTPFIVYAMLTGRWGIAFVLFIVAALTDLFDGMLARLLNQKTFLGTCLDPIADKFLLVSCFATLACTHTLPFSIPQPFLLLILWRETFLIGGATGIYLFRGYIHVQPTFLGKLTTFVQIVFIAWLFACYFFGWQPTKTYYMALVCMTGLIVASFIQYGRMGIDQWHKK